MKITIIRTFAATNPKKRHWIFASGGKSLLQTRRPMREGIENMLDKYPEAEFVRIKGICRPSEAAMAVLES